MPFASVDLSRRRTADVTDGAADLVQMVNGGRAHISGVPHPQDHDLRLEY